MSSSLSSVPDIFIEAPVIIVFLYFGPFVGK